MEPQSYFVIYNLNLAIYGFNTGVILLLGVFYHGIQTGWRLSWETRQILSSGGVSPVNIVRLDMRHYLCNITITFTPLLLPLHHYYYFYTIAITFTPLLLPLHHYYYLIYDCLF